MTYFQLLGPFLLATFSISFLLVWRKFPRLRSAGYFALSYGCLSAALTLDWMRDGFNPVVASYLTNIPYLATVVFYAAGLFAFSDRAVRWRALFTLVGVVLVFMIWFRHIQPDLIWRTLTMAFGVSGIMLFAVFSTLPHTQGMLKKAILWSLALVAILSLVRTFLALMAEADTLSVENYSTSIVAWTLQLSMAMSALAVAILLFAHYGMVVMRILTEDGVRQRRHVEAQFSKFLSPAVVANMLQLDVDSLAVEKRVITAFIVDLRGFTSFSHAHGLEAASARANRFFAVVTEEILARNGTIDKYLGDAVLAFWNAPLAQDNHADLAIEAGLSIQARLTSQSDPMEAVIAIESGECSVGNFGTMQRLDYTAIGGAMNLVARLENEAKARAIPILVGPGFARCTSHALQQVARISISGISGETSVFAPLDAVG